MVARSVLYSVRPSVAASPSNITYEIREPYEPF